MSIEYEVLDEWDKTPNQHTRKNAMPYKDNRFPSVYTYTYCTCV